MTARNHLPFGSADEGARAAAEPALAALRGELLVLPRQEIIENHVDMMVFEQQLLATPRFAKTRAALPRPRRAAFVFLGVCATLASCGLSAAGALPAPLQHITDTIARTLGVPQPHQASPTPHAAAATPPTTVPGPLPAVVHPTTPITAAPKPADKVATVKPKVSTKHATRTPTPVTAQKVPSAPTIAKARPTVPSRRIPPRKHAPKPSNDSTNTPAGYPNNWRKLAAEAATAQLQTCAAADSLAPTGCPQVATAAGTDAQAQAQTVQWTLVSAPASDAVVVARVHAGKGSPATTVYVYKRFQMGASYTEVGGTQSYRAYSGGIAAATMTWNGSSFNDVTFTSGSAVGHLLPGVTVPLFERPAGAVDNAVLAVVQAGFTPPVDFTSGQGTVTGDPTQGAVVTFDTELGDYTVTGTYTMTSSDGTTAGGPYTATLYFDGQNFQIVGIAGT